VKEVKHWKTHIIKSLRLLRDIIQNYYHKKEYIVKLEEQKQFYKKLFENFDDTLYIVDNNYVVVDLNDEYMLKN
jgi:transcriptional regulator with PAS, ATPase and Fis domain